MLPSQRINSPSLSALLKICEEKKIDNQERNNGINKHKTIGVDSEHIQNTPDIMFVESKRPIMVLLQMRLVLFTLQ